MDIDEPLALDQDQLRYLTDEEKARLMRLQSLFSSEGWPLVASLMSVWAQEAHNRAANSATWEQNRLNVGLREAYVSVANLQKSTVAEFIGIADERRAKALEADLDDELKNQS